MKKRLLYLLAMLFTTAAYGQIFPITGSGSVCAGGTTTFYDASSGGTWSSSNPAIAAIGSGTGIVNGVSAGTATITYSVLVYTTTTVVTVNPLPAPITGSDNVCVGYTTTLSDTSSGGLWSSSVISVAPVGSATGIVAGASIGASVIRYTLPTGCIRQVTVTVNPNPTPIFTSTTNIYTGSTTLLLDATPGGAWSSFAPAVATVNSFSGLVQGVSSGIGTIYYTLPTGCNVFFKVTVNSFPDSLGLLGAPPLEAWYPFCGGDTISHGGTGGVDLTETFPLGFVNAPVPTTDRFGNPNDAFLFNGTSNALAASTHFPAPVAPYTDFYYSCWFNIGGVPQKSIIMYNGKVGSDGWGFTIDNGAPTFAGSVAGTNVNLLFSAITGNDQVLTKSLAATASGINGWHNVVLQKDGINYTFYVDRVPVGTVVGTSITTAPSSIPRAPGLSSLFQVGIDYDAALPTLTPPVYAFNGKIDDIAIFNRNLSGAEQDVLYDYNPDITPFSFISGPDTTICQDSITLAPYPQELNTYYTWYTADTTDSMITVNPSASTFGDKLWLNMSKGTYGCSVTDTVLVFKRLIPINLGNDTNICIGDTIRLGGNSASFTGSNFHWNNGATTDTILAWTTGKYWVVVDSSVCIGRDTIRVNTHAVPVPGLGPDRAHCDGQLDTLRPQFGAGYTYQWSDLSTADTLVVTTSGNYWVKVNDSGCVRYDTINVYVVYDTMTFHFKDTAFCKGGYLQPNLTVNPFATFQWRPTTGIADGTLPNPTIRPDTSATYILTVMYPHCPDIVDSFHIDVQPYPVVNAGAFTRDVCEGDTLHLTASIQPRWYTQYRLRWSPTTHIDNDTFPTIVYTAALDTTNLILTVTTPAGCKGVDSTEVWVHPGHFDSAIATSVSICPRDSVQLGIVFDTVAHYVPIIATYHWSPGTYLSDSMSANPKVGAETDISYRAIGTSQWGCRDTLYFTVQVKPAALLDIGPDSVILYPGESYQVSPQTNCVNFSWTPSPGLSDTIISNPVANPLVNSNYFVRGSTIDGCVTRDSVYIVRNPETIIDMPNAFTPGQSVNNIFMPVKRGIIAKVNTFQVFDRWGVLVYDASTAPAGAALGWDGTYQGKMQPFGVYVYQIDVTLNSGGTFQKTGNVTLLR